jgi:hypothetical protein
MANIDNIDVDLNKVPFEIENNHNTSKQIIIDGSLEEELIHNFYVLLFYSNPMVPFVKFIIDGGLLKTHMKKEKFLKIIEELCPEWLNRINVALMEYGKWFLLDRHNGFFQELDPVFDIENMSIKQIHEDTVIQNTPDKVEENRNKAIIQNEQTIGQVIRDLIFESLQKTKANRMAGIVDYRLNKNTIKNSRGNRRLF